MQWTPLEKNFFFSLKLKSGSLDLYFGKSSRIRPVNRVFSCPRLTPMLYEMHTHRLRWMPISSRRPTQTCQESAFIFFGPAGTAKNSCKEDESREHTFNPHGASGTARLSGRNSGLSVKPKERGFEPTVSTN